MFAFRTSATNTGKSVPAWVSRRHFRRSIHSRFSGTSPRSTEAVSDV